MAFCIIVTMITGLLLSLFWYSKSHKIQRHPYSNPGLLYPLKTILFYYLMKLKQNQTHRNSPSSGGYGLASHNDPSLMESPQILSSNFKAIDAVFFSGSSMAGWGVVLAMERRPKRISSVLVYLRVPDKGVFVPLQHPDAVNFRKEDDEDAFAAGGLIIKMIKPTKEWNLKYHGKLRPLHNVNGRVHEVTIDLQWNSSLPLFNYDTDLDACSMSKAFAREPWSTNFFGNLRQHHQSHYEQMGNLKGFVTLDEQTENIEMPAFRDHTYGNRREWALMHRYYFHHVFLSDGTKGVLGLVCQPSTCTRLVLGHWWNPKGEGSPVSEIDLELSEHGEGGTPPTDYAFTFVAGGIRRTVEVKFVVSSSHYLGWDWEAKLFEVFVNYKVDGISGTGICEWQYTNRRGRPEYITASDPEWTKTLRQEYLTS